MKPPAKGPSMNEDPQQTRRILDKLSKAHAADPKLEVFGADAHGYVVGAPASPQTVIDIEKRIAITLPEAYRRFLLEIGNGGDGYNGSAAGPFYGVYGVGDSMGALELEWLAKVVANPCILTPGMSQPDWEALVARLGLRGDLDDEAHDEALATLFGGLLPVGSQGCSIYHGLVVNGPDAGRVVNYDMDLSAAPVFAFEPDFLAWYERWLDEIIAGDLLQKGPSWFGYTRGGPEVELLAGWLDSEDAQTAQEYLAGLLSKKRLSDATLDALAQHRRSALESRSLVCQIVCKHDHTKAQPLLAELATQEPLAFLQCLHWYARDHAPQWKVEVLAVASRISDLQTFQFFTYVLEALPVDRGPILVPFTRHEQASIRRQALHALGKVPNRQTLLHCFVAGLGDDDGTVVHAALQALKGLKDRSLLPHYRRVAERYPEERDYVLVNLDHRLKELGTSRAALLRAPAGAVHGTGLGAVVRHFASQLVGRRNARGAEVNGAEDQRLIEVLEHMEVLKSTSLRLEELMLDGVPYGCVARDFPTARVTEVTLAPIVKSSSWSSTAATKYWGEDGGELTLADVIDNALAHGGILHFSTKVSFRIRDRRVVGFAIYGSQLDAFRSIQSQEQLVREFGQPDHIERNEAHGDLMRYLNIWTTPPRKVVWDEWDKRISVINLG